MDNSLPPTEWQDERLKDGWVHFMGNKAIWTIFTFFALLSTGAKLFVSPKFEFEETSWYFQLYAFNAEWMLLRLIPLERVSLKKVVSLTLGIMDVEEKDYISYRSYGGSDSIDIKTFFKRSDVLKGGIKITLCGELTIFCMPTLDVPVKEAATQTITEGASAGADRALQNFKALALSKENSDVILKVKDQEFRAHKAILGAQSSVFRSMFKHDLAEKRSGIVDIADCDPDAFQDFLLYLYSGKVEKMTPSSGINLYTTADKYDIAELKEECLNFMAKEMSVDNFCDFVALALRYNELKLLEAGTAFFTKNTKKVIVTAKWQTFMKENTVAANELYIKVCEKYSLE